jgi:hypothetical protein
VRLARPLSTRPGPTSTKRWADLPPAHGHRQGIRELAPRILKGCGGHRRYDGGSGRGERGSGQRLGELRNRGGHHRRVKGAGDIELRRPQPELLGLRHRPRQVGGGSRQHHLLGRVVVGNRQRVSLGYLWCPLRSAGAEQGDHAAVAGAQTRLVHEPAPQRDQLQPLALCERPRGHERAELTKRVTGHQLGARAAHGRPARQAGAEDRRLGEVGSLVGTRERILAHDLCDLLQQLGCNPGDEVAHVRRLAPLAGKQDRGDRGVAHAPQPTPRTRRRYRTGGEFPPFGGRAQFTGTRSSGPALCQRSTLTPEPT